MEEEQSPASSILSLRPYIRLRMKPSSVTTLRPSKFLDSRQNPTPDLRSGPLGKLNYLLLLELNISII